MAPLTRALLAALVFTLPFDQAFAIPVIGSLGRAVGLLVAGVGLLALLSGRLVRIRRPNAFLLLAAVFVGWNALSVLWAVDPATTLVQVFTYVQLWVMAWLIWQFIVEPSQAARLRQAYMLGTWVTVGTIVWAFFAGDPTVDPTRYSAFGTNANYTAQSVVLAIPMALDAAVNGRGWRRFFAILLLPACVFGLGLTGSRGGALMAAFAVVGGIALLLRTGTGTKLTVLTAVALTTVVVALALPAQTRMRFADTVDQVQTADFSGRGEIWHAGFQAWLAHPAIGAGSGTFERAVTSVLGFPSAAHDSFLNLLVELGPMGPSSSSCSSWWRSGRTSWWPCGDRRPDGRRAGATPCCTCCCSPPSSSPSCLPTGSTSA